MNKLIIKTVASLPFAVLLVMGSMPVDSQANEDNALFLSNNYGEMLAFNSGVRGKPPYRRAKRHSQQKQNRFRNQSIKSVEMSALEIDQGQSVVPPSKITKKSIRGGHPDRAKRRGYR